ncbi:MAG: choice-of-anchor V domain-containing protein [Ignavibacteria bacterium]
MKTTRDSIFIVFFPALILILLASSFVVSNPNGISGRTKKTMSAGCSSCHNFGTGINGIIEGPDSVEAGQTAIFTITINFPGSANGGVDIAAKRGTLSPGASSTFLKLLNGELTHKNPIQFTTTISLDFNYTAPVIAGTDTLYANIDRNYPGVWNYVDNRGIKIYSSIGIVGGETPAGYFLSQNFPNPFNPRTVISFGLKNPGLVKITIYDITGKEIAVPLNSKMLPGIHSVEFRGDNLNSGLYFYAMDVISSGITVFRETKKMILIK